jgi:metallo-beta-lactamase class B
MIRVLLIISLALFTLRSAIGAQTQIEERESIQKTFDRWNEPVAPFRLIGNIYFVGMRNISAFLLVGNGGHILIDTGFSNSVPLIQSNIVRLGFSPRDIKYILSSHAHCDHVAGHAGMKRLTGAKIAISKPDAVLLESGGRKDFLFAESTMMHFEPVTPDVLLEDQDRIRLGNLQLTAHLTPGHTPGCTTWATIVEENGRRLNVVFFGSTSINPGTKLLNNAAYPNIAEDIRATYRKLRALPCDVFLAPHPEQFGMHEKQKLQSGANAFVDSSGLSNFLKTAEEAFERELADQSRK